MVNLIDTGNKKCQLFQHGRNFCEGQVIFRNNTEQDRTGSFSITGKQERCYEIDDGDLQEC